MLSNIVRPLTGAVLLILLVSFALAQGGTGGPMITSYSWSDVLDDDNGLAWMEGTDIMGDLVLSRVDSLGEAVQGGRILAATVGSDGRVYLGADGAYVNVYDPTTGDISSLGGVPGECYS